MGEILTGGSGRKWNLKEDPGMTGRILGWDEREFKDENSGKVKRSHVLTFMTDGGVVERNSTTQWDRWFGRDVQGKGAKAKVVKVKPVLRIGSVVKVRSIDQIDGKGGHRFYNFAVEVLTGKEIPKSLRK